MRCWVASLLWLVPLALGAQESLVYQPAFREPAMRGLGQVYNCQFLGAQATFARLAEQYPTHPGPAFLQAVNLWWQLALNTQATHLDAPLVAQLDRTIALADAVLAQHPDDWEAEFLRYSAWGFKARLQVTRGEMVAGGRTALKTLPVLKRTEKFKPNHPEFLFGSGLYLYFREWYADRKPILKPLLGLFPKGDKVKGLQELRTSVATPNYTSTEAAQFLTEIYLFAERKPEQALPFSGQLVRQYPGNPFFHLWHGKVLYHAKRYAEARQLFERMILAYNRVAEGKIRAITLADSPFTTQLMQSVCLYYALTLQRESANYETALAFLEAGGRFCRLNGEADTELRAQLLFQEGNCLDRLGRRNDALARYEQVLALRNAEGYARLARGCKDTPCTGYTPPD